ncbi:MAG: GTP pyrophosphokinase family protein [Bacilli bacterium]|nr:GTP pyrophosphokinase family protein [Bacilli bacterium]
MEKIVDLLKDTSIPRFIDEEVRPFRNLMLEYRCALKEVETKFDVLSDEFSLKYNRNPVESIKTRLKSPNSILGKLKRKNLPLKATSIEENLNDVAGIRIICSFIDDIYDLVSMFTRQDDIKVIEVKDYIKNPKENGYRSLHLIIEVPIFLTDCTKNVRVEVQFRTIAMDFWASLEHEIKYKKNVNSKEVYDELRELATINHNLDVRMQNLRKSVELK